MTTLMSLKSVVGVGVSILATYWHWGPEGASQKRYIGEITRWASKEGSRLCIRWEDRTEGGSESLFDQNDGVNFLLHEGFDFRFEAYKDGRPAPTPPLLATPFLLAQTDLRDEKVLLARVDAIVAPAHAYFAGHFDHDDDRAPQMARMEVARIFDPLHVKSSPITGSLVDGMSVFAFSKCDKKAALISTMKLEVTKYNTLVADIPPLSQR